SGGNSTAGSGAIWNLKSNALRPAGWTSADAAGLPIFAGLVRIDEVKAGKVDHAIRMTASQTDKSYVWPARHQAGAASNKNLPPMGARFRLKASFSTAGLRSDTKVILSAMKKYGLVVADNGSDWYFTGAASNGWSNDMLDELKSVPASAFEGVYASSLMVSPSSGKAKQSSAPPPAPAPSSSPKPKPKPKPSSTPSPTQTPSVTPVPVSSSPSPSPSRSALATAPERKDGRSGWRWLLAVLGAGLAVLFSVRYVRRRAT
ncbi:MAG: hypothetical protein ACRDKS_05815, partial [Actinomycetota bacterium]